MFRLILAIALIGLVFWGFARLRRHLAASAAKHDPAAFEKTVQCTQCEVYVSLQQAIERNGRYYCCAEHLPQ